MILWNKVKKELKRSLTVMLIPHNSLRPLRINFSLSFILFLFTCWTGVTVWAGYLSSRHIDYWKAQVDNELMKLKVSFFAQEIQKSQMMLEQVKSNDEQIRTLLEMKSKKAIVEKDGKGGPFNGEKEDLMRLLEGKIHEMNLLDIYRQTENLKKETKLRIASYNNITDHIYNEHCLFRATPNIWPCKGRITSTFGYRIHPIYQSNEFHSGIDLANIKNTPVMSTGDGIVKFAGWQSGYGKLVIIDHGYGYLTLYGHLGEFLIKKGTKIVRGQSIGLMGNTGTSTGNHVHYEIRQKNKPVNPYIYLNKTRKQLAKTR